MHFKQSVVVWANPASDCDGGEKDVATQLQPGTRDEPTIAQSASIFVAVEVLQYLVQEVLDLWISQYDDAING
jgi:hypothetical protein